MKLRRTREESQKFAGIGVGRMGLSNSAQCQIELSLNFDSDGGWFPGLVEVP